MKLIQSAKRIILDLLPAPSFVKYQYFKAFNKKLDLKNPKTFNEKIQYLKIYDRNPLYTILADKIKVKDYVAGLIGSEHVIPNLGTWDSVSEITLESLPRQFVLKCNHDSGSTIVCTDSSTFDFDEAKDKLNRCLKRNFYYFGREWSYKHIQRKVFAEQFMSNGYTGGLIDYKFYCFDGKADCVMVCIDRQIGDTKFYFFDKCWNLKRINKRGKEAPLDFTIDKPEMMDEMFAIAEKLSKGIPFVRIDLYQCEKKVYFGEYTFYPHSGTDTNYLPETEMYFGSMINLDNVYSRRKKK